VRRYRLAIPYIVAVCLIALSACAQTAPTITQSQVPPVKPGMARVWFLRGSISPQFGAVQAFSPEIYANGAPVATIPVATGFYRDFPPGTYRFTVQPFGLPTPQATTLQLAPGTVSYLNVDWVASWTQGYPPASWNFVPNTFAILTMAPQVALAYLPTLGYLGER
jgi:hypothetical protein